MAYSDLREWIAALEKAGELKRVKAEADPILEVTEIADRVSKWGPREGTAPAARRCSSRTLRAIPDTSCSSTSSAASAA